MNFDKLDKLMDSMQARYGVPGCQVWVYYNHRIAHRYSAGFADEAKTRPVSERDLYILYSATKVITNVAMMRLVDILYAIPNLLLVILIMLVFGSNVTSIMIGICLTSWIGMARLVRAQVMSLKEQEFALAAYVLGASRMRILFKHLIINCMGSIIVNLTLMVPSAIFTEAFLSFVGIGISAPAASWGTLANEARSLIESSNPVQIIWPILAICLTMLSLNFIGDGVSDAFDPKKK